MNSNSNQFRAACLPAERGALTSEQEQLSVRRRVLRMLLAVGGLTVVLILVWVFTIRSSQLGGPPELVRSGTPLSEAQTSESPPTANAFNDEEAAPPVDSRGQMASVAPESPLSIPDRWGIEITNVRLAAGGKALDLRYKVLDVAKATSLLYLTNYVYIFNHSNSKALMVPFQRENQTSQKLVAGKTYFTLLPNKEERVQAGSSVTVVVGGSRAENLLVN